MDTVLQALLSWQFLLFCLAIAALTFVVRKIVEFILDNPRVPASKTSKLWREVLLPILPVVGGGLSGGFATHYPYPDGLTSASGRVIFGLVAGLFSGLVYRMVNSFITSKITTIEQTVTHTEQTTVRTETNTDTPADTTVTEDLATKVRQTINKE